jgi:carboxyl-terminal processing protease
MRKLLAVFISFTVLTSFSIAQAPSPAQYLLDEALTTFEERYFGFKEIDFKTLDHDANAKLEIDCKDLIPCPFTVGESTLDDTLIRVGDGHTFRLTPIAWAQFVANSDNAPLPMIGLKFAALPDASALVVTRVLEGSPAKLAGIERGDVVWALNGVSLEQYKSATQAVNAITTSEFNKQTILLEVSHLGFEHKTIKLEPAMLKPWLPSYDLRSNGVAVITFYQYLTGGLIASRVHDFVSLAQAAKAKAIVLDVRGSGGGSGFESVAAAGAFVEPVGTQFENLRGKGIIKYQNGEIANTGFRIANPANWTGTVLVLTNHISRSAAEYMAFFLQESGRAKVIGEATAGVLNTSTSIYPLPGGSSLAVTSGRSSTLAGAPNPELVTPDVVMTDDMGALSQGHDLILTKALEMLK